MTIANAKPDLLITGPIGTTTVNAASSAWHDYVSVEAKITAAIAYAVSIGAKYCYVPDSFLPYTASLVTFNTAIQMIREGGDPRVWDIRAYGATGDGVTDDSAAINAAGGGAGVGRTVYAPKGTYVHGGYTVITNLFANQTWVQETGATYLLKPSTNTHMWLVNAAGITFTGGTFDGNRANNSGSGAIFLVRANNTNILNLTVQNSALNGIQADTNADNSLFFRVTVTGCLGDCVFVGDSINVNTLGCTCDATAGNQSSNSHPIQYVSQTVGKPINGARIEDNFCKPAFTGCQGIVYGQFGGDVVTSGTITGNVITFAGNCNAGISIGGNVSNAVITGNTVNANGFTPTNCGIEVVACTACTIGNNTINGGTTLFQHGIILNGSSHCTVTGNTINGFSTAASANGIALMATNAAPQNLTRRNTVTGNNIIFPAGSAASARGIFINANFATADVSENIITSNYIEGTGNADGIRLLQIAGTIDRNVIAYNVFRSLDASIEHSAAVTNTAIGPNTHISVTNIYSGNLVTGGARMIQSNRISADKGDTSPTVKVDVDEETILFNTALTAARTCTITIANSVNGARFRVTRGPGATGAFNLTVQDSTPTTLKVLATASTWVDVGFDGAAWREVASGTL